MSRPLRVDIQDGWYHVTSRGNERKPIFRSDRDYARFLETLGELPERFGVLVAAYVLMDNHYHLILQTPQANLSLAMQWLNVGYSIWFNRRHRRTGHLMQGRFKAILVDQEGAWLWGLSQYVHLNPVRVADEGQGKADRLAERQGLSPAPAPEEIDRRLARLRGHRWSSYLAYAGYVTAPGWLSLERILTQTPGRSPDLHRRYREQLEEAICRGVAESPWSRLQAQVVLGTESFWRSVKAKGDRREMTGLRRVERRTEWEEVVRAVEDVKGEPWSEFRDRYGDWGRDLVLAVARRRCAMTLARLGERSGGMDYRCVSQAIRGFERKRKQDRPRQEAWEAVLQRIDK